MLNDAQNISTGVPIQLHDGHVHHEAPRCVPFLVYISMPEMFQMDSFSDLRKRALFQHGTYWFLSGFGYKIKTRICEILKRSVLIISEI